MLLSSPKARLITFFKTRLTKSYLNSLLMTDPVCLIKRCYFSKNTNEIGKNWGFTINLKNFFLLLSSVTVHFFYNGYVGKQLVA